MPVHSARIGNHPQHHGVGVGFDVAFELCGMSTQGQGLLVALDQAFTYVGPFDGIAGLENAVEVLLIASPQVQGTAQLGKSVGGYR